MAMVHRQHVFTPEDRRERLPLTSPSGAVLTADLRLNDRDGLRRALDLPPDSAQWPDGAVLMRALDCWGVKSALDRVQGNFAFALWNPQERRLTLARDPSGFRTLFVHRGPRLVAFSTRLRALLALPEVPRDLDERALADRMIMDPRRPARTLYRAIDRVPLGHFAVLTAQDTRTVAYWTLPEPGSRPRRDADLLDEAQDVLDRAVKDALRAEGPVSQFLTGGLDSTSVAASAARQLAPAPLLALTRVPHGPTPPITAGSYHDETPRAAAFAALHPNIDWQPVDNDGGDWGEHDPRRWFLEAGQPNRAPYNVAWFFPLYRRMAERGSRVFLDGGCGNSFYSTSGEHLLTQLLLSLRWPSLARHLWALSRTEGVSLASLLKQALRPLEPLALRQWRIGEAKDWGRHCALNPNFTAELQIGGTLDRSLYRMRVGGDHRLVQERRRWTWNDEAPRDTQGVLRAMTGIDQRIPLADRRVVEFFGSLPLEDFLKDGVRRSLARRMLAGQAPAEIIDSRCGGKQNGDWHARVTANLPAIQADLNRLRASPMARRVVDVDKLQTLLDTWPADAAAAELRRASCYAMLTRGMEMGRFLAWHEGGNG